MNIFKIIEFLPDTVKIDVIDFTDVKLKDGRLAIRVTLDRLLTEKEKGQMQGKHFVGIDCVCKYRYAPEICQSYFYLV